MDPQNPQTNLTNDPVVHTETENKDISSNVESGTEILKQGAVKAIIWEDIVAKGYDTMDFAKFLGDFQRGNLISLIWVLSNLDHNIAEGNWTQAKLKEVRFYDFEENWPFFKAIVKFKETNSPQFSDQVLDVSSILSKASKQKAQDAGENAPVTEEKKEVEQPTVFEVETSDLEGRRKTVKIYLLWSFIYFPKSSWVKMEILLEKKSMSKQLNQLHWINIKTLKSQLKSIFI